MSTPKLSICLSTFKRAKYIAQTLDSIFAQVRVAETEVIIVNGASPDDTDQQVAPYLPKYANLRYYHEPVNSGVDGDFDKAVQYATGEYCWLMSDDDLLLPGAIQRVLQMLERNPELLVVNSECWNADLSKNLHTKMLNISEDKTYTAADPVMAELSTCLSFIASVIIKRDIWLARDRKSFYGSLFIHVGVIYQHPPLTNVIAMAEPLIKIRYGNGMWTSRSFEIWYFMWPRLIWSFSSFSDSAKAAVVPREPWRSFIRLFKSRAIGDYSVNEFKKFLPLKEKSRTMFIAYLISIFPAKIANFMWVSYYSLLQRSAEYTLLDLLGSRHSSWFSRKMARVRGVDVL